jgi:hypothetical protein
MAAKGRSARALSIGREEAVDAEADSYGLTSICSSPRLGC